MTSLQGARRRLQRWVVSAALLAAAVAVSSSADDHSSSSDRGGVQETAAGVDTSDCYVVTIFGLKTADCNKQNSKSVPRSLDSDLQVMRFEDNRLTLLADAEFAPYANLQEIYLARNRIELVSPTALRGLYSLQILDLDGNQLGAVPSAALRQVGDSLRLLSLKGNPIRRLDADALSGLVNLEEVNFENCWLNHIDAGVFAGLSRLAEINLVNNELQTIDSDAEPSLSASSLRVFRLYRNPWTCNCRLRWLRRWITSGSATAFSSSSSSSASSSSKTINWDFASNTPTCAAPALIRGVAWRHLTPDHFACPTRIVGLSIGVGDSSSSSFPVAVGNRTASHSPPSLSGTAEVRAVAGRNATIECVAVGDPEPTIAWSRDPDGPLSAAASSVTRHRGGGGGGPTDGEPTVVGVLTFVAVNVARDSGDYRCTADNPAGRAEVSFRLTVVDGGAGIAHSGRVAETGNDGGTGTSNDADDGGASSSTTSSVDRDALLGIVGGLLVLVGAIVLFVACRPPRCRDCVGRQRGRLERRRRRHQQHDKNNGKLNDYAATKPLNNVAVIGVGDGTTTMTSPAVMTTMTTTHVNNNCNTGRKQQQQQQHHQSNHNRAVEDAAMLELMTTEEAASEPEEDDDDDDGQYDSASCETPLTCNNGQTNSTAATGNGGRPIANRLNHRKRRGVNNDDDDDDEIDDEELELDDTVSDCSDRKPEVDSRNRARTTTRRLDDDECSSSDKLSDAASCDRIENCGGDHGTAKSTIAGSGGSGCPGAGRHERSCRTVSFGPDLVLDADVGGRRTEAVAAAGVERETDIGAPPAAFASAASRPRQTCIGETPAVNANTTLIAADLHPTPATKRGGKPDIMYTAGDPAATAKTMSTSSSSASTRSGGRFPPVVSETGSQQTTLSPLSPVVLGEPQSVLSFSGTNNNNNNNNAFPVFSSNHVLAAAVGSESARLLPVGRPCIMWPKTEEARCRSTAATSGLTSSSSSSGGRRRSEEAAELAMRPANGSAFGQHHHQHQLYGQRQRPSTTSFCGVGGGGNAALPAIAYSSLERRPTTTRRCLPQQPSAATAADVAVDDRLRRHDYTGSGFRTSTMPRRGNGSCGGDNFFGHRVVVASGCHGGPRQSYTGGAAAAGSGIAAASYTLADILAPPFGGVTTDRKSNCDVIDGGRKYVCADDDDTGTAII